VIGIEIPLMPVLHRPLMFAASPRSVATKEDAFARALKSYCRTWAGPT